MGSTRYCHRSGDPLEHCLLPALLVAAWLTPIAPSTADAGSVTARLTVRARVVTSCRLDKEGFSRAGLNASGQQTLNCNSGRWGSSTGDDPRARTEVLYGVSESTRSEGNFKVLTVSF
jgi:hypothetical protein